MIRLNTVLTLVATAALAACTTLGPNYQAPAPNAPASYRAAAAPAGAELQRDWWLVFALRLATTVLRRRSDAEVPLLGVAADEAGFSLALPNAWLDEHPLTEDALQAEAGYWKAVGMRFTVVRASDRRVAAK